MPLLTYNPASRMAVMDGPLGSGRDRAFLAGATPALARAAGMRSSLLLAFTALFTQLERMARTLRTQYPGAWYHVMNRGAGGEGFFSTMGIWDLRWWWKRLPMRRHWV